ncbi:MAG: TonB-dependent receptor [Sphingomonadaceae bacterium]|nr:TonB-dependent receptor [Sphingomonadaceae bacterium]
MKTTKKTLSSATYLQSLALAGSAIAMLASTGAYAQEADEEKADETIVVTGSLIRNPNLEASSPINVVGEDEIQLRNTGNAEDLLRSLPGAVPGIGSAVNNGNGGFASVDLRGLGAQRNLVLLDGDRLVVANQQGTVDLNNIPLALVQRVDVLTGGASTTYGADAVTGVVNFVTRKDFAGVNLTSAYEITDEGDGQIFRTDLTIGGNFDDGRGNAVLSVGYQKAKPVYQGDRDISVFGISSTNGRASGSSFTSVPTAISFPGAARQVNAGGTAFADFYNGFNFNPYNIFQTPYERFNIYGSARYEVTDSIEVYARGVYSKNRVSTIIAPSGIFGEALTIPGNNPFLPAAIRDEICTRAGIALGAACNTNPALPLPAVYRRTVEIGPRISDYTTQMFDYRAGVKWDISDAITFDVSAAHGESELDQLQSGYVLRSRVQQALNATSSSACTVTTNGCVPLNLWGPAGSITPAMANFLNGSSFIKIKNKLSQVRGVLSGDTGLALGGDNVTFALGGEYREYGYERIPDAFAQSPGELGGAGGAVPPFKGGYNVAEIFGELNAPLVEDAAFAKSLVLELGARYSSYKVNAAGNPKFNTWTYKAGLTWEPVDAIKLRGNYQRAVRAPNINELFRPVSTGLTSLQIDPCAGTAPVGNANLTAACVNQGAPLASIGVIPNPTAGQANQTGGGNPLIQPEKADTFTVGAIFQPDFVPGLTLTVDYYNIKVNQAITAATPADVLTACFGTNPASITAAQAASAACTGIRRNSVTGGLSGPSSTVFGLPTPLTNLGRLATKGIDFSVNYKREIGKIGLNWNLTGNWTDSLTFRASPASYNRECVGYYSANCGPALGQIQPEFSFQQRTTLTYGDIDFSILWRHIGSVQYEGQAADFAARGFTTASRNLFSGVITNAAGASSPLAGQTVNMNKIGAYNYIDLSVRFNVNDNLGVTVGVSNLFDKQPPLIGSAAGTTTANSGNTFPSTYDPLGRAFNASVSLKF